MDGIKRVVNKEKTFRTKTRIWGGGVGTIGEEPQEVNERSKKKESQ